MRIMVTGGAGFIGSAVVGHLLDRTEHRVLTIDKLTYAADPDAATRAHPRHNFTRVDICDAAAMAEQFRRFDPDIVMHLAAESHVDRSIDGPGEFIQTNVVGTCTLLQVALAHWRGLDPVRATAFRFHHVSTDEVYGDLSEEEPPFAETHPYRPSSPYSASKAASDHLARAWHRTYGLPVIVSNCSNNYGPRQFPEKLIPLMLLNAIAGKPLPVYGDGTQIRDWLYVEDHAEALVTVALTGRPGETYNIGGRSERRNIDVVHTLCDLLEAERPTKTAGVAAYRDLITHVTDRPGHDRRYAIDDRKIEAELGWTPSHGFEDGLRATIRWYLDNLSWCERVRGGVYAGQRLGIVASARAA